MADSDAELEENLVGVGNKLQKPPLDAEGLFPLLDEAEMLLLKVEQSPSESLSASLRPLMDALVAKELLGHVNMDVKVAVASCISEITRITAPEAPYSDDTMKDIFAVIVEAFQGLDDVSSQSYNRRVSILETVAKVRSCVVMLDLECDALILEMFRHFLATIRESHSENVFSLMETIMTLVLEESEDISLELLSCLLGSVKNDNKDILPIARTLGEKVIRNCSLKLKPNLLGVVRSSGTSLTDYSRVVTSICQDNPDTQEKNDVNASAECMEDDSKLSERTISEELPQGSGRTGVEPGCSDEVNTTANKTQSAVSNGTIHAPKGGVLDTTEENGKADKQNRETTKVFSDKKTETASSLEDEQKIPKATDGTPSARPKRGRPPGLKSSSEKAGKKDSAIHQGSKSNADTLEHVDEAAPSKSASSDKQAEDTSDSENKPLKHLSKKKPAKTVQDSEIISPKDKSKKDNEVLNDAEDVSRRQDEKKKKRARSNESSKKESAHRGRPRKASGVSQDDEGKGSAKMPSSLKTETRVKDQNQAVGSEKTKSGQKRGRGAEGAKGLDENLVGSCIKVLWPDDDMFYRGVIGSYDPCSKKHKVLYDDGDVEVLNLRSEVWDFVSKVASNELQGEDVQTPDPSEMVQQKKGKAESNSAKKQPKAGTSMGSGSISAGKVKNELTRGRSKHNSGKKSVVKGLSDGKLKEKTGDMSETSEDASLAGKYHKPEEEFAETPKLGGKSSKERVEMSKSKREHLDAKMKSVTKSKATIPKSNKPLKINTNKGGSKGKKVKNDEAPEVETDSPEVPVKVEKDKNGSPKAETKPNANGSSEKEMMDDSPEAEDHKGSAGKPKSSSLKGSSRSKKRRRSTKS